jgi:hypothetical protein
MLAAVLDYGKNVFRAIQALYSRSPFKLSSWTLLLLSGLSLSIFISLVQNLVMESWYNLNFKEPWTSADYPPLCSENTIKLLPWRSSEYPVLSSPASYIRILQVHPSNGLWGIEATLKSYSFLERPQYKALSYTWGNDNKFKPITVNGKRINVTENLWNALFHIRDAQRPQNIWVDAICIEQSNNEEKSMQIPLMSFIYSRAQEVVVWLGVHKGPRWVEQSTISELHGNWATSKATDDWSVTRYWLYLLTQEEYWKRCWIVQELAMASRIRLISGSSTLPWHEFIELLKLYKKRELLGTNAIDKVLELESLREAKYFHGYSCSLYQLLEQFADCFCSDNLDKIFAFVGIASDCLGGCIDVDYSKSPLALYQDLLTFQRQRSLVLQDDPIETLRLAGLARSILARKSAFAPKLLDPPGTGDSANSLLYILCGTDRAEFCRLIPSLRSILSWADVVHRLFDRVISYFLKYETEVKSLWLPLAPESTRVWLPSPTSRFTRPVRARGIVTSQICQLGPTYREFIESSAAQRRWSLHLSGVWGLACNKTRMQSAKTINDRLSRLLGTVTDYRMRHFVSLDDDNLYSFYSSRLFLAFGVGRAPGEVVMGLAPWKTQTGDKIVQFWKSDAALVIREDGENRETVQIGRAGVVKDGGVIAWDIPQDRAIFEASDSSVELYTSVDMITKLSLDTVSLPDTQGLQNDDASWGHARHTWTSYDIEMTEFKTLKDDIEYEKCWDFDQVEHIDESTVSNLEDACFATPCLRYTNKKLSACQTWSSSGISCIDQSAATIRVSTV